MVRRAMVAVLVAALAPVSVAASPSAPPPAREAFYVVRPDPRLCPSPLCGGYWVALANHARTRCSDRLLRPRCYVASAVDGERHPLRQSLAEGTLVRGDVESWAFQGAGRLGVLVALQVRTPVGKRSQGAYYRARDLGNRCVKAPCYSLRAARLNRSSRRTVSSVDLASQPQLSPKQLAQAQAALQTPNGLLLLGRVIETSDAGTILQASRIYLRAG